MDPLAKAYLKVINEKTECSELQSKEQKVKGYTPKEGQAFGDDKNAKKIQKKSGPDADGAETPQAPQEARGHLSTGKETDGSIQTLQKNSFDALFDKILSEERGMMDFSTAENPEDSSFEPSFGGDQEESDEFGESEDGESEDGESEDQVTITIDRGMAEKLVEVLNSVLNEGEEGEEDEEGEDDSGDDMGDMGSGEDDEEESSQAGALPFKEAVEAEEKGHALVDQEKLMHGLNAKGSYTVKGAVPVTKKSAQTPATGKGHDGKLKAHSPDSGVKHLTSKGSVDTKLVKVGKTIFDND